MALIDRAKLLQTLIALPPQQFSQIEFALKLPDGIMPGITAPLADRAIAAWVKAVVPHILSLQPTDNGER